MKVKLTVLVDGTDDLCEKVLDELETALIEHEGITISSGGGTAHVEVLGVEEVPT